jgi:hypothetical protein
MLVTVENQLSRAINSPDTVDTRLSGLGVAGLLAEGGSVTDPLPYPFDKVGELAANGASGDSIQRAMHIGDFRRVHVMWTALDPNDQWNQLVQAGTVTLAFAAESGRVDSEEEFDLAIV